MDRVLSLATAIQNLIKQNVIRLFDKLKRYKSILQGDTVKSMGAMIILVFIYFISYILKFHLSLVNKYKKKKVFNIIP